jgi:parvulin-like peptidyl-prolyl isomerase
MDKITNRRQAPTPERMSPGIRYAISALSALTLFLSGCKKEPEKAVVLAQVGNSTLTLDELRESFPPEYEQLIRREQYLDFIKRWMDDEAVYQQAIKAKLEDDTLVGRKLEKIRRKMLIEEFLARENATEVFEPDEIAMNQYYEMHKEEFRRKVPEIKYAQIRVQTAKQASELRYKANRADFLALAGANSLDPVPEAYSSIAFKKQSEFPACLSQEISQAGIGAVTLPVACPDGFYLIKVIERQEAGSLIPLAEAKEEIGGILAMERKDKLMDGKISRFKEGLTVTYNLDQIPGLTETSKPPEAGPAIPAAPAEPSVATAPSAAVPSASPASASPDPRLPREPAGMGASASAVTGAPDPRLPREPFQIEPPAKPKYPPRKRIPKPVRSPDSSDIKAAAPRSAAETTTETPGQKPEAEENSNAQPPIDTP